MFFLKIELTVVEWKSPWKYWSLGKPLRKRLSWNYRYPKNIGENYVRLFCLILKQW